MPAKPHPVTLARETKGLSREELARMIDVEVDVIWRLERGTFEPGPLLLGALEKALDTPRHILLGPVRLPKADRDRR
jgi:ribosome-binding protein aMBF1 (putative translation factor)